MTKQEAIKILTEIRDEASESESAVCYVASEEDVEAIDLAIEALQDDWMPVSEGLPEEAEIVLGTFYYEDEAECAVHETYLTNAKRIIWGHNPTNEVIAWMPLPEPYEKSEDE